MKPTHRGDDIDERDGEYGNESRFIRCFGLDELNWEKTQLIAAKILMSAMGTTGTNPASSAVSKKVYKPDIIEPQTPYI